MVLEPIVESYKAMEEAGKSGDYYELGKQSVRLAVASTTAVEGGGGAGKLLRDGSKATVRLAKEAVREVGIPVPGGGLAASGWCPSKRAPALW